MKFIKINLLIILIANIIIPSPINEQTAVTIGENFFYSKNIREDILKNSPDKNKDFFVVPKVVE